MCIANDLEKIPLLINGKQETFEKRTKNFHLSPKAMEGYGVQEICKRLKEKAVIKAIVHDNDASTINHVKELFPDCLELLDNNHGRKNLKKALLKLKPEFSALKKVIFLNFVVCIKQKF